MKRLYKSRKDKMIAGVCGGLAEYFDVDPVLVRILFVIFTFIGGFAVIAYIVGMIIMPFPVTETTASGSAAPSSPPPAAETGAAADTGQPQPAPSTAAAPASKTKTTGALVFGIILVVIGAFFLMRNIPFLRDYYWWFRWHFSDFLVPGIFIIFGIALLVHGSRKKES
jgi:phage shock protein C